MADVLIRIGLDSTKIQYYAKDGTISGYTVVFPSEICCKSSLCLRNIWVEVVQKDGERAEITLDSLIEQAGYK